MSGGKVFPVSEVNLRCARISRRHIFPTNLAFEPSEEELGPPTEKAFCGPNNPFLVKPTAFNDS